MKFNEDSRQKNALLASSVGVIEQGIAIVSIFVYRTIFLTVLSKEYLGIEGLFTNILQLFSMAELGIGSAILYRMYKPFADKNVEGIGAYVHFYKNVYHGIALIIIGAGACLYPFITSIVNVGDVPSDVNLHLVYVLFVLQSVSSYFFVYKQSLVMANQKGYLVSLLNTGVTLLGVIIKTVILVTTHAYEWVLLGGIIATISINWIFSLWITKEYKEVFEKASRLNKSEKMEIVKDTSGLLCHKIGYVVLTGTDNIVLTKMVSLAAVGIYTNYATITTAVMTLLGRVLNGFVPTIGNFIINYKKEAVEDLYNKLLFVNLWFASFCTVCLYVLLNPFIEIWLDDSYLLDGFTVAVICAQFYIKAIQFISNAFINGAGLFARDRIRPLIESGINLIISIILAKELGIAGVFIGTCISSLCTVTWREPYLLYKNVFKSSPFCFIRTQLIWGILTCMICILFEKVNVVFSVNILGFIIRIIVCAVGINALLMLIWCWSKEFKYFFGLIRDKIFAIVGRK